MSLKHFTQFLFLCLLVSFLSVSVSAQNPYSYDTSTLPSNIVGLGVGSKLSVGAAGTTGVSNTQGFGFQAYQVTPGLFQYSQVTFQGGTTTVAAGGSVYAGTLFKKLTIFTNLAPGVSFTAPTKLSAGAIGNVLDMGGDIWIGLHKTAAGNKFVFGAGGSRALSNQPGVDSFNLRAMLGFTF